MPGENYICVIAKFKELSYHHAKFQNELRAIVGEEAFPWTRRELLFRPPNNDLPYVLDENVQQIAKRYEDCSNDKGFLSLISVTYNYDTFGAEDGLYGKIVVRVPRENQHPERTALIRKVLFAVHNHVPVEEGEKLKVDLTVKNLPSEVDVPSSIRSLWMKAIVERRGRITQHILFGKKGDAKKVHVFRRTSEAPTYENTPAHHTPRVAPFRQICGVVVKDGMTHTYHLNPEEVQPSRGKKKV